MNAANLSQVIYRPPTHPSQSHHPAEFIVYVDLEAYSKWKAGDSSIPLVDILASSKDPVLVLPHGQTGIRSHPSKQELAEALGSEDAFEAARFVLQHGRVVTPSKNGDLKNASSYEK